MNWRRTWPAKLGLAFALPARPDRLTSWLRWPVQEVDPDAASVGVFFHVFPLARVFEFTLGMTLYQGWRWLAACPRLGPVGGYGP